MIQTPHGAQVAVAKAPEHLGSGVLVIVSMRDTRDNRRTEVYLDRENQLELVQALLNNYIEETP